jgi:predicted O-methyltransferase YrrM
MLDNPEDILERIIVERKTQDLGGNPLRVTGAITISEARYIERVIVENQYTTCLETGVAYGASTIAICAALSLLERAGKTVRHYGVDPCQMAVYGGAAIAAVKECRLDHIFELCEGPSHLMLPKLLERGLAFDFIFIDGMHTFDYTLVDLFLSDKLLRPGGTLCLHDMNLPSKQKAMRYLAKYRRYARLPAPNKPLRNRIGPAARALTKGGVRSALCELAAAEPMAAMRKLEEFEPGWDFYAKI